MTPEELQRNFDRLEDLVSSAGYEHEAKLREFNSIVRALLLETANGYARAQLRDATGWAVMLFSERKHRQQDTATSTGAERIQAFIREDLSNAERNMDAAARD